MKKILAIMDSRTLLYAVLCFFFNMFSVSNGKFIFDFFSFKFHKENLIERILTTVLLLLFTIICATIIRKIEIAHNGESSFLALLLIADPLLNGIRFDVASLIVLIITIMLCVYLYVGKSLKLKTVLAAVYILILSSFCPELICSYNSIVVAVFGVSLFEYEKDDSKRFYKKSRKSDYKNIEPLKKAGRIVLLLGLVTVLSIIFNKLLSKITFFTNMMFCLENGIYSYKDINFWLAVIPYAGIFIVFINKYFYIKNKSAKRSAKFHFIESKYFVFIAFVFISTLIGIFVFENSSSLTIFNVLIILNIMLMARYDPSNYAEVIKSFSEFYQKHKFMLWTLFIIWFVFVQYQFRYTLYPGLSHILHLVGGRL